MLFLEAHSMTTILSLMFHRVNDPSSQCCPHQFADYLRYLVDNFPIVTPDSPLPKVPLALMLTFDDAYFDFYQIVFPLLKQHNIKALLAVPVKYILPSTSLSAKTRLSVPYPQGMENGLHKSKAPFCTWEELKEMADSTHVIMASHSYSHANLSEKNADFNREITKSKIILEKNLAKSIDSFVYPYGKTSKRAHQLVSKHYRYGLRIGSAINRGWAKPGQHLYRVDADKLWKNNTPINNRLLYTLTLKYWINRLRGK